MKTINNFISKRNNDIKLFTPGPGSLVKENIMGLRPCFGRNDKDYKKIQNFVINKISRISGQKKTVALQGSGSLAIEIMCLNFLYGNVTVINTGYYSDRLNFICKQLKKKKKIKSLEYIHWKNIKNIKKKLIGFFIAQQKLALDCTFQLRKFGKFQKK